MMGGFGMAGGGILWLLIVGLVIWAIVRAGNRETSSPAQPSAREVLDARLARGEITIDEYRKLRAEL